MHRSMEHSAGRGPVRRCDGAASRGQRILAAGLLALLTACGGGGGDGDGGAAATAEVIGPPATAASLANTADEASKSAAAAVSGAEQALQRVNAMNAFAAISGSPVVPQDAVPGSATLRWRLPPLAPGKQALAVETATCGELLDPPCTGSARLETNVDDTATTLKTGDWINVQFQALSGRLLAQQLSFNGSMRLEFLAPFDPDAATLANFDAKVILQDFSGAVNGAAIGPLSDAFRLQVNAQGTSTITAGGTSLSGMRNVTVSGSGSYRIGGGTVRLSHWTDSSRYVDMAFDGWQVVANRPAVGSVVNISAGAGRMALRVTASSSTSVVYAVTVSPSGGGSTTYTVTASYPAGGGAATYSAVLAG